MSLITRVLNAAYATEPQPAGLVGYLLNEQSGIDPPPRHGGLFDYVLTAGGLYVHAKRDYLEACFPISRCDVRGAQPLLPMVAFKPPIVPLDLVSRLWMEALEYGSQELETLFHLAWSPVYPWNDGWELVAPNQTRSGSRCRPLDDGPGSSHARAIIEVHSHHRMPARFSPTDDEDETGFRLYGVIGGLFDEPEIRLRVGVYGYFWDIQASRALELPDGLRDCNAEA